jgi:homocysteine S-methyltransferase
MSTESTFQRWIEDGPILADGAMGTMLHAAGVPLNACFDELNLTDPDTVRSVHRAYLDAGARILETNTFGANRFKLALHGLEDKVGEINRAAVELARELARTASQEVLIAGSIGPLGVRLAPFGRVKPEQAQHVYREQIEALVSAGADLLILETQNDLMEVQLAIEVAKRISPLPVIASMTFTRDDRTLLGDAPEHVARVLAQSGADIIGANCSSGPSQLLRVVRRMRRAAPDAHYCALPNAGWPEQVGGRVMYAATPAYFAEHAHALAQAGAVVIGGCCGTTPEHIAAMGAELERAVPSDITIEPPVHVIDDPEDPPAAQTGLSAKLEAGRFVIAVEMDPPRGFSTHKLLAGAHLLAEAGADVINVADSPMARMRMSPWAVCHLIQREVGVESVLHFPTRGRNLLRVQGDLLAAHALDVRNIFVVMGDPTSVGDYPEAMDDYDVVPSGLIRLIRQGFNSGVDHAGADIGEATSFFVGCALNLCASDPDREAKLLHKKIQAGAAFALTQPVYDVQRARRFLDLYREKYPETLIPILVGILPLYNARHAAFLHNEVPGIMIPEQLLERISNDKGESGAGGVEHAVQTIRSLHGDFPGVYLMPPFHRYDLAAEIIERVREPAFAS